jgi:eukaryotic-like serine/threonine-protein kinase
MNLRGTEASGYTQLLLARARAHLELGRDGDAHADLRELLRTVPACGEAYRLLGELAHRRNARGSAATFFRHARRLACGTTPPPLPFGPYAVYEKLGEGGMATVHRAIRRSTDGVPREVALKRLLPSFANDPEVASSLQHEARLARLLRHPNIARTYDAGRIGGVDYLAMELLDGTPLSASLGEPVAIPIVIDILIQLCDALAYAHTLRDAAGTPLGIVHRDLTPSNVIVTTAGAVKLIDFGIAKAATQRTQTRIGVLKGKLAYLAPEYVRGRIDARADLFALGVIAHELLTGRRLFVGDTDFQTVHNVLEMRVPPPARLRRDVCPVLDDIVMLALRRVPEERWQSAAAMRTALRNLATELGTGGCWPSEPTVG